MIDFFCPYCKHYHAGATHLVTCELHFIKTAPMKLIIEMCELNGVTFTKVHKDKTVLISGRQVTEPYLEALLTHRFPDFEKHFYPEAVQLDDKWIDDSYANGVGRDHQKLTDDAEAETLARYGERKNEPPIYKTARAAVALFKAHGILIERHGEKLVYKITQEPKPPTTLAEARAHVEAYLRDYREQLMAALPDATGREQSS